MTQDFLKIRNREFPSSFLSSLTNLEIPLQKSMKAIANVPFRQCWSISWSKSQKKLLLPPTYSCFFFHSLLCCVFCCTKNAQRGVNTYIASPRTNFLKCPCRQTHPGNPSEILTINLEPNKNETSCFSLKTTWFNFDEGVGNHYVLQLSQKCPEKSCEVVSWNFYSRIVWPSW